MDEPGTQNGNPSGNQPPDTPKCPHCDSPIPPSGLATVCHRCGTALPELTLGSSGRLLMERPAEPVTAPEDAAEARPGLIARVLHTAGYGASLPERFVRSLAAGLGGLVKETAELALPDLLKRTTIYSILLDRALRFIVEDVGQVEGVYDADEEQAGFVVRKIVGNFVELAGLLTLQASPLWVLALVGDAAFGVRTYLDLLVEELKKKEILATGETVESASVLLGRLERLSATGALAIDLPPMALKDLRDMADRVSREARGGVSDVRAFREQADRLLEPMREVAKKENVSLFDVSAVVGMQAARTVTVTTAAIGAGARLLNEQGLRYYVQAVRQIQDRGFYTVIRETHTPYTQTVAEHFRPGRQTLTDELLSGELFRRLRQNSANRPTTPQ